MNNLLPATPQQQQLQQLLQLTEILIPNNLLLTTTTTTTTKSTYENLVVRVPLEMVQDGYEDEYTYTDTGGRKRMFHLDDIHPLVVPVKYQNQEYYYCISMVNQDFPEVYPLLHVKGSIGLLEFSYILCMCQTEEDYINLMTNF